MHPNCVFCEIAQGQRDCVRVVEQERVLAFMDVSPINPGHILVIPQQHAASFYDLDEDTFVELMVVVRRLAVHLQNVFKPRKVGMLAAGFDVDHAHVHVLPMHDYHDITSKAVLEGTRSGATRQELEEIAVQIRRSFQ
jgi:histidine triad (HIT) family protein